MFIDRQENDRKEYYQRMLQTVGSLSKLFSESEQPYLFYRIAENLFCKSFNAENLSRSDTSADARLDGVGFGLKTFLQGSGSKMEKVAQFNNDSASFRKLSPSGQVDEIARLRNERIETTMKIYGLREMVYHCVTRSNGKMSVIETPMNLIDIDSLKIENAGDKTIRFSDKLEQYTFNISNSTLSKRFIVKDLLLDFPVKIMEDPFLLLENLVASDTETVKDIIFPAQKTHEHVFLPLYSTRNKDDSKEVSEKSGLNQWNAGGRKRSIGEVYIPVPAWIHKKMPNFFPPKDVSFTLHLPDKQTLSAKLCQDGNKALMSNPNEALGRWILRDVLNLKDGELLTYKKLEDIGLDAVVVYKIDEDNYEIDFAKIGSYDQFEEDKNTT